MPKEKIDEILGTWRGFTLAVSGNTVYIGKRDGHLVASFDMGNNWLDLTPALPFPVKAFNDIVFAGTTVYVGDRCRCRRVKRQQTVASCYQCSRNTSQYGTTDC